MDRIPAGFNARPFFHLTAAGRSKYFYGGRSITFKDATRRPNTNTTPPAASVAGREAAERRLLLFLEHDVRTIVYIDGFNLYYGCLRRTPYKWLDVRKLCELLLPSNNILRIKYFTARVSARDDPQQPYRQEMYLRALRTLRDVEVHYGRFLVHEVRMPLAQPNGAERWAAVLKTEEKGSDVNLAAHLLHDAHLDRFDAAALLSNDSDLATPLQIVRNEIGKKTGLINPHAKPSRQLARHADFYRTIRKGALAAAQFPHRLVDAAGEFHRPATWA